MAPNAIIEASAGLARSSRTGPTEQFRAIYAGRILEWKGIAIALEAFEQRREQKWTLEIYGEGVDRARLEDQTAGLGLTGVVKFMGLVDREVLFNSMHSANAFIFPSLHDSSPWVVAEAAVAGLPVLCFPQGGSKELAIGNAQIIDINRPAESINQILDSIERGENVPPERVLWDRQRVRELLKSTYCEVTA
ncbi:glycosyltransferase [Rhodococcus sp. IEGM 1374]|uniref:glycosyltransferase n=1 Tax=Rhodococcus sp. IEGM 1374 TaxID=3082221 RepID=UPI0029542BBE|nr:glycosyltransferase [Rhodococcus sp. IEGM 1374]MDV7991227.1 glycosyltransferase [Rhodococcus sp. IEGM 1374]